VKYYFISPWKISKTSPLYAYSEEFFSRISHFVSCEWLTPQTQLKEKELIAFYTKEIKKCSSIKPVCFAFDENGKQPRSSEEFAKNLKQQEIVGEKVVLFCFGGAYGLPKEILSLVRCYPVSLSPLTFSHELAFCVALEQIYRARCILANHPYHHGEKSPLSKFI
jgi:23S rRNA (pseudouridine1915-N3)-methyltransferase